MSFTQKTLKQKRRNEEGRDRVKEESKEIDIDVKRTNDRAREGEDEKGGFKTNVEV